MNVCCEDVKPAKIVESIKVGDPLFEELFVRKYRQPIVTWLRNLVQDGHRAEDLAHDALIIVLRNIRDDRIKEPEHLSSYLYQTAKFCYYAWLRKSENQVRLEENLDGVAYELAGIEAAEISVRSQQAVRDSLNSVKLRRDRDVLLRQYVYDQSASEICEALSMAPENYHRVISRARLRFKEVLPELLAEELSS